MQTLMEWHMIITLSMKHWDINLIMCIIQFNSTSTKINVLFTLIFHCLSTSCLPFHHFLSFPFFSLLASSLNLTNSSYGQKIHFSYTDLSNLFSLYSYLIYRSALLWRMKIKSNLKFLLCCQVPIIDNIQLSGE